MNILVIVAHPNIKSFNRGMADIVVHTVLESGHEVIKELRLAAAVKWFELGAIV